MTSQRQWVVTRSLGSVLREEIRAGRAGDIINDIINVTRLATDLRVTERIDPRNDRRINLDV